MASPISHSPLPLADSRTPIHNALSSHEASPSVARHQNALEDLIKARLGSQNQLAPSNFQSNIYSQYVMSQAPKSPNTSVTSASNVQINKINEINGAASPQINNIHNSTPTKSVEAPADATDDFKTSPARVAKQRASEKKTQFSSEPNLYDLVKSNSRNSVDHHHHQMNLEEDSLSEERDSVTGTPQKLNKGKTFLLLKSFLCVSAELPKKKVRQCFNQFCITDPTDATKWCRQKVRNSNICKQCFDAYKKQQFCYYCYQIYDNNSSYSDGKEWIGCEDCNRWVTRNLLLSSF